MPPTNTLERALPLYTTPHEVDVVRISGSIFRGTPTRRFKGAQASPTYALSLPVAVLYSGLAGDPFARTPVLKHWRLAPNSTVHWVEVDIPWALHLKENWMALSDLYGVFGLPRAGYPSEDIEVAFREIIIELHEILINDRRHRDRQAFSYEVLDEDDERLDPEELPLALSPELRQTLIGNFEEDWIYEPTIDTASRLRFDTYALVDTQAFRDLARARGFQAICYQDVLSGIMDESPRVFGIPWEDLPGLEEQTDIEDEYVAVNESVRILDPAVVRSRTAFPAKDILEAVKAQLQAELGRA